MPIRIPMAQGETRRRLLLELVTSSGGGLPVEYKRLPGIKFDGDFHYETNEKLFGSDVVTLELTPGGSSGQNLFGSYSGTVDGRKNFSLYVYGTTGSKCYLRYNETLYRPTLSSKRCKITFGAGGTTGFYADVTYEEEEFETTSSMWIGMLPNSTSPGFTGSLYGKIKISDRLIYIPCKRISDDTIGYYELKSGMFLEPVGSGTPTPTD